MNAKRIYYYFIVYQHILKTNNNLPDADTITVEWLIDFVENHTDDQEREEVFQNFEYYLNIKNAKL